MLTYNNIYDVLVVGAGPAGATSARELSKSGYKVLLIDKERFPRRKTCGGLIPIKALNELDFKIPDFYIKNKINKLTIYDHKMNNSSYESNETMGVTTLREEFDHHLLNRAISQGAHFQGETSFKGLEKERSYMKVTTSNGLFYCRNLIGSDGVFSRVRKYVEDKKDNKLYKMGFTVNTEITFPMNWAEDEFKLFQVPILYSMGWAIPCKDHVNVGIGGPWFMKDSIIRHFDNFLYKLWDSKEENPKKRGGYLPAGGFNRRIYKNNVLLVGDAGGFVDPLTGEGLYYAFRSGKLAAQHIINENEELYEDKCKKELYPTLRASLVKNIVGINKIHSRIPTLRERLCCHFSNTMYH